MKSHNFVDNLVGHFSEMAVTQQLDVPDCCR